MSGQTIKPQLWPFGPFLHMPKAAKTAKINQVSKEDNQSSPLPLQRVEHQARGQLGVEVGGLARQAVPGGHHRLEQVHRERLEEEGHLLLAVHNALPRLPRLMRIGQKVIRRAQDRLQDRLVEHPSLGVTQGSASREAGQILLCTFAQREQVRPLAVGAQQAQGDALALPGHSLFQGLGRGRGVEQRPLCRTP